MELGLLQKMASAPNQCYQTFLCPLFTNVHYKLECLSPGKIFKLSCQYKTLLPKSLHNREFFYKTDISGLEVTNALAYFGIMLVLSCFVCCIDWAMPCPPFLIFTNLSKRQETIIICIFLKSYL